jgi:8-oxo-dGTP pyrophosphatase MutT (NUDIX family)
MTAGRIVKLSLPKVKSLKNTLNDMFTIGAFAIIFDEGGRVLLCHRRDLDVWNLPGGGVESREMPDEAVVREVKEETGLPARFPPPNRALYITDADAVSGKENLIWISHFFVLFIMRRIVTTQCRINALML